MTMELLIIPVIFLIVFFSIAGLIEYVYKPKTLEDVQKEMKKLFKGIEYSHEDSNHWYFVNGPHSMFSVSKYNYKVDLCLQYGTKKTHHNGFYLFDRRFFDA